MKPEGRGFKPHPGQSFPLSLCGPISICRANAHMVYGLKHQHFTSHSITLFILSVCLWNSYYSGCKRTHTAQLCSMPGMLKANERCYKRTLGLHGLEALNHRSELKMDTELKMGYISIAGRRTLVSIWSQMIAEDRTMFYLLRSSAIAEVCFHMIAELSAICDPRSSAIIWKPALRSRRGPGHLLLPKQFQKRLNCPLLIGQKIFFLANQRRWAAGWLWCFLTRRSFPHRSP